MGKIIVNWGSVVYLKFRKLLATQAHKWLPPVVYRIYVPDEHGYNGELISILEPYGGKVIELRKKPPGILEFVDALGMNDRHAFEFNDEELYTLFLLKWG